MNKKQAVAFVAGAAFLGSGVYALKTILDDRPSDDPSRPRRDFSADDAEQLALQDCDAQATKRSSKPFVFSFGPVLDRDEMDRFYTAIAESEVFTDEANTRNSQPRRRYGVPG